MLYLLQPPLPPQAPLVPLLAQSPGPPWTAFTPFPPFPPLSPLSPFPPQSPLPPFPPHASTSGCNRQPTNIINNKVGSEHRISLEKHVKGSRLMSCISKSSQLNYSVTKSEIVFSLRDNFEFQISTNRVYWKERKEFIFILNFFTPHSSAARLFSTTLMDHLSMRIAHLHLFCIFIICHRRSSFARQKLFAPLESQPIQKGFACFLHYESRWFPSRSRLLPSEQPQISASI